MIDYQRLVLQFRVDDNPVVMNRRRNSVAKSWSPLVAAIPLAERMSRRRMASTPRTGKRRLGYNPQTPVVEPRLFQSAKCCSHFNFEVYRRLLCVKIIKIIKKIIWRGWFQITKKKEEKKMITMLTNNISVSICACRRNRAPRVSVVAD